MAMLFHKIVGLCPSKANNISVMLDFEHWDKVHRQQNVHHTL